MGDHKLFKDGSGCYLVDDLKKGRDLLKDWNARFVKKLD